MGRVNQYRGIIVDMADGLRSHIATCGEILSYHGESLGRARATGVPELIRDVETLIAYTQGRKQAFEVALAGLQTRVGSLADKIPPKEASIKVPNE